MSYVRSCLAHLLLASEHSQPVAFSEYGLCCDFQRFAIAHGIANYHPVEILCAAQRGNAFAGEALFGYDNSHALKRIVKKLAVGNLIADIVLHMNHVVGTPAHHNIVSVVYQVVMSRRKNAVAVHYTVYIHLQPVIPQHPFYFVSASGSAEKLSVYPEATVGDTAHCRHYSGVIVLAVAVKLLFKLGCLLLHLVKTAQQLGAEIAEHNYSTQCAENVCHGVAHRYYVKLALCIRLSESEPRYSLATHAKKRRTGLRTRKQSYGLAFCIMHQKRYAESHRKYKAAHNNRKQCLLRSAASQRLEKIRSHAVAYRKKKHHEEKHLHRTRNRYYKLTDNHSDKQNRGDASQRKAAHAQLAYEKTNTHGKKHRQSRIFAQYIYKRVEHKVSFLYVKTTHGSFWMCRYTQLCLLSALPSRQTSPEQSSEAAAGLCPAGCGGR